jgi:hypothetical protein
MGLTGSSQKSLTGLSNKFRCTSERFGDDTDDTTGDSGHDAGRISPAFDQSLDGVMCETADGPQDADSDPTEAVDEALAEALRSLPSEDFVSAAVLVVEGQPVQVS